MTDVYQQRAYNSLSQFVEKFEENICPCSVIFLWLVEGVYAFCIDLLGSKGGIAKKLSEKLCISLSSDKTDLFHSLE